MRKLLTALLIIIGVPCVQSQAADKPNIVFILFDDLGYGEPPCYRADSPFKMPTLDRLAREGMRFTDAHSASAVCTPTRYGVLTGRYPMRIGQFGVLQTFSTPIIESERLTVASMLKQQGYHTGAVGKWHLGMTWDPQQKRDEKLVAIGTQVTGGPMALGFDYFCGYTHAANIGMVLEQDKVAVKVEPVEVQPLLAKKAVAYIDERAKAGKPFFLYVPLCTPHMPHVPAPEFQGKGGAEKYGDWIHQGDWVTGQILDALERNKLSGNTLVIVTSDNGAEQRAYPPLRESKRSIYEGGHRVPFLARWPGKIKPGSTCADVICLNDLMATAAEITGAKLPANAAEDSVSILPNLLGTAKTPVREATVHQSMAGDLAIRQGPWKLIFKKNGGRELYNLTDDLSETKDLLTTHPDLAGRLAKLMQSYVTNGRSTPGLPQKNQHEIQLDVAGQKKDAPPQKSLPLPGEAFQVQGRTAFIILPQTKSTNALIPWVWYAPTLPGLPGNEEKWMFERFTQAGIAIAGIDVGESFGSPDGRALYSAFYDELIRHRAFAPKAVMLGRSRGGLMTLSWAAENAGMIAGFAGIYPVCNINSYPGVTNASSAYRMTVEELTARLAEHNPIDRLAALAKAGVPLFAIHGDIDQTVPLEANSGEMRKRYEALGGKMQLIVPPGQGHNMWEGFFQCQELVDFVLAQVRRTSLTLSSPLDYQVVQRKTKDKGSILITGVLVAADVKASTIEARIIADGMSGEWQKLAATFQESAFQAAMVIPAGGWYRVEVRALSGDKVVAETSVEHVGVGEVFVIAGQSNSANHGEEKQNTMTGKVATFDGKGWQLSNDPQPGASGGGGSFLPPFGDAMAQRFNVPVGFVACGIGATSVREWLPKGAKFPNPPTLTSRVQQIPSGEWESKGEAFDMFVARMKQLGPHGFRAVLWHQGESDANQQDTTRTLPGNLYREYLEKLIRESRRETGWDAPWFVAQVSYHVPGDEASPDIRAAQASLWKDGIALQGPDTDALKGEFRDSGGKGVHFSGAGLREHAARWVEKVAPWLDLQSK